METEPRRFEPWPWALGALLLAMIGGCLVFWWIAISHPDPLVLQDSAGLLAPTKSRGGRP